MTTLIPNTTTGGGGTAAPERDATQRIVRTILQLLAGGALYGLTELVAADVPAQYAPYVVAFYTLLVTVAQNLLEQQTGKAIVPKR